MTIQGLKNFTILEGLEIMHLFIEKHGMERISLATLSDLASSLDFLKTLYEKSNISEMRKSDMELVMNAIITYDEKQNAHTSRT